MPTVDTSRKGNGRERRSCALLEGDGWLVGSRRHIGGAGDLLAVKAGERPMLIEVKATLGPYAHFGPKDRAELREAAKRAGAVAVLAWWKPRAREHRLIDEAEWP